MQRPDVRTPTSSTRPAGVANPRRTRLTAVPGVSAAASPAAAPTR